MNNERGRASPGLNPPVRQGVLAAPYLTRVVAVRLLGLFLASRALVLMVATLSRAVLVPGLWPNAPGAHSWIDRFQVWDTGWYLSIVRSGYSYNPLGASNVGFYPLYPLLIRALALVGLDPVLAGYLISHLALAGACVLLWKLAALETGSTSVADRATTFLLFSPGAVWFGMVYTESLFLVTMLGCLFAARQGRWLTAGLWGLAAALTRTPGVLLAGFLFLEAVQQWLERRRPAGSGQQPDLAGSSSRSTLWRPALAVLGPIAGQLSFMTFEQAAFGDWRAQQKTVAMGWHTASFQMPWTVLWQQWRHSVPCFTALADSLLLVVVATGILSFFTLRRASYGMLVFALAVLYVSSSPGMARPRYLSTTAPVYLVLAQLAEGAPLVDKAVLIFSTALLTLLTALLVSGYQVT